MPSALGYVGISDVIDVIATSILIYYVLLLIRGTRAVQILTGILVLIGLLGDRKALPSRSARYDFEPDRGRRGRDHSDRLSAGAASRARADRSRRPFPNGERARLRPRPAEPEDRTIARLRPHRVHPRPRNRRGALIVIEQQSGLKDYCESGTMLRADISEELLLSIFAPASPLHDGAVDRSRGPHRSRRLLPAAVGAALENESGRHPPSRRARTDRTDRCRRARRFGANRCDHHRARAACSRAPIDDEQRLVKMLLAVTRPPRRRRRRPDLDRASPVALANAAWRAHVPGFVKAAVGCSSSERTSR